MDFEDFVKVCNIEDPTDEYRQKFNMFKNLIDNFIKSEKTELFIPESFVFYCLMIHRLAGVSNLQHQFQREIEEIVVSCKQVTTYGSMKKAIGAHVNIDRSHEKLAKKIHFYPSNRKWGAQFPEQTFECGCNYIPARYDYFDNNYEDTKALYKAYCTRKTGVTIFKKKKDVLSSTKAKTL
jgi:hypothetical protein